MVSLGIRLSKEAIQLLGFIVAVVGAALASSPNSYLSGINDALGRFGASPLSQSQFVAVGILIVVAGFYAVVKAR